MYQHPHPGNPRFINRQHPYPHNFQWTPNITRGFQQHNLQPPLPEYQRKAPTTAMRNYNEDYWCETCDRGFPTLGMLESHKQQHQKCNIDGCQFIAHPKVITKHIQMQHSSGLFKKIAKLNNPEEIQRWIDERKKKYPTKLNVDKKAAEIKEKIERGEKMGLGNKNHRNYVSGGDIKRKNPFSNQNHHKNKMTKENNNVKVIDKKLRPKKEPKALLVLDDERKLKPFAGIRDLFIDYVTDDIIVEEQVHSNNFIEDDDDVQETPNNYIKPTVCGALSSLMCDYESSDEEKTLTHDKTQRATNTNVIKKENIVENTNNQIKEVFNVKLHGDENHIIPSDDDSGPEEEKVAKTANPELDNNPEQTITMKPTKRVLNRNEHVNQRKKFINNNKRPKRKIPSTLLQKLLSNEIRQERNTILQCIKYVRKHNYFDKS